MKQKEISKKLRKLNDFFLEFEKYKCRVSGVYKESEKEKKKLENRASEVNF